MRRALLLGLSFAAAGPAGGAPQDLPGPPRFATGVDAVYVDVFVTHRGAPVPGLTSRDFEVEDEGTRQEVVLVERESVPLTVVLVFDTSSSVQGEKLLALRAAGNALLDALPPAARVAFLGFNHEIELFAPLGPDRDAVRRGLAAMSPGGSSAVFDALFAGLGLAGHTPSLVLLFSDGEDNLSWLGADDVRASTERANALVHVIGFVPPLPSRLGSSDPALVEWKQPRHVRELRRIAEVTGGRFWSAESPARIREAFAAVAAEVDARYLLRFEPKGIARPGWHRLDVRLKRSRGTVRARRGYYVAPGPHDPGVPP